MLREFVCDSSLIACLGKLTFDDLAEEASVDGCVDDRDLVDESIQLINFRYPVLARSAEWASFPVSVASEH